MEQMLTVSGPILFSGEVEKWLRCSVWNTNSIICKNPTGEWGRSSMFTVLSLNVIAHQRHAIPAEIWAFQGIVKKKQNQKNQTKQATKKPPKPTKTTKPQTVDHTGMLCYSLIMSRYWIAWKLLSSHNCFYTLPHSLSFQYLQIDSLIP